MNYDSLMIQLADGMRSVHGDLEEVIFLGEGRYISLLCFSDGTVLPTYYRDKGDRYWQVVAYAVNKYPYIDRVASQISDRDPFSLLTFGYSGTGAQCYSTFLRRFRFVKHDVENIQAPSRLKKDGGLIEGSKSDNTISWQDNSATPEARIRKRKGLAFWKKEYLPS